MLNNKERKQNEKTDSLGIDSHDGGLRYRNVCLYRWHTLDKDRYLCQDNHYSEGIHGAIDVELNVALWMLVSGNARLL